MARIHAIGVANLMSENYPTYGNTCDKCTQSFQEQEVTAAAKMSIYWEQQWPWQRRWKASPEEEDTKEATKAESI